MLVPERVPEAKDFSRVILREAFLEGFRGLLVKTSGFRPEVERFRMVFGVIQGQTLPLRDVSQPGLRDLIEPGLTGVSEATCFGFPHVRRNYMSLGASSAGPNDTARCAHKQVEATRVNISKDKQLTRFARLELSALQNQKAGLCGPAFCKLRLECDSLLRLCVVIKLRIQVMVLCNE